MRASFACLPLVLSWLALPASAHPLAPALLELHELPSGSTAVLWRIPARLPRGAGANFGPVFPDSCHRQEESPHGAANQPASAAAEPRVPAWGRWVREGRGLSRRWEIRCSGSLAGQDIEIRGLAASGASALFRIELADGRGFQKLLDPDASVFRIPLQSSPWAIFHDYFALGWQHILSGPDHLLFVLGLTLWVRGRRQLLWTITAFSIGHSLTLSLSVLGWVNLPQAPIEALIALSIAALAVELARSASHAGSRAVPLGRARPPILASAFGLLHGLGFAGALAEIGVPPNEIPSSLLSFNLGIEFGQLAFMAAVLVLGAAVKRLPAPPGHWRPALRLLPPYTIGSLAAFWFYQRLLSAF